jgi:uncharacterized membrane protein YdjX (TVP38/TMEM64 family)
LRGRDRERQREGECEREAERGPALIMTTTEDAAETAPPEAPTRTGWKRWLRPALMLVVIGALWLVAEKTGLRKNASAEKLHAFMQRAGAWGVVAYLGAFSLGTMIQVPGTIFLLAARIAYGPLVGGILAYVGAVTAVTVSFVFARTVGGRAFAEIKWKPVKKLMTHMGDRPVTTIAIVRLIVWMSPPLNYTLAMSTVRFRDYVVGSAIGLLPPVALVMVFSDWILSLVSKVF